MNTANHSFGSRARIAASFIVLLPWYFGSCDFGNNNSNTYNGPSPLVLTVTGVPGDLQSDNNTLMVFLPYVLANESIENLMEMFVISDNPTIKSGSVTAKLKNGSVYKKIPAEIAKLGE
jgi:hypothetical protein